MQIENNWKKKVTVLLEENLEKSRKEKEELICKLQKYTKDEKKHIVFFGCGVQGQMIYHILKKREIKPDFYCDNNNDLHGKKIVDEIKCISPVELKEIEEVIVLLTVGLGYANIIYEQLRKYGINDIIKFPIDSLHLYPTSIYDFSIEEIAANMNQLFDILSDEQSKKIAYMKLYVMLASLSEMNFFDYSDICTEPQYYPEDIIKLNEKEIIVEGGAYVGDSLQYLIEKLKYEAFQTYYCFELDKGNYIKLTNYVESLPDSIRFRIQTINAGIGLRDEKISYMPIGEGSNILEDMEGEKVQIVTLDEELADEEITFIKMDIEGSEIDALKGGREIIKKYKPKLAICVYHKPEHLWEVPFLIREMNPDYKLYLRHHTLITTDTVCYALDESR